MRKGPNSSKLFSGGFQSTVNYRSKAYRAEPPLPRGRLSPAPRDTEEREAALSFLGAGRANGVGTRRGAVSRQSSLHLETEEPVLTQPISLRSFLCSATTDKIGPPQMVFLAG